MEFKLIEPMLGFENLKTVTFSEQEEPLATIEDKDSTLFFTLVNPYALREYSFDVTLDVQAKLGIKENSKIMVYNIVAVGKPSDDSVVNFLAPIIFNCDNNTAMQVVLDSKAHPDFSVAHKLSDFEK